MEPTPSSSKRKHLDDDEELGSEDRDDEFDDDDSDEDSDDDKVRGDHFKLDKVLSKYQKGRPESQLNDIKVTPFNLKAELEDGEFDRDGNFIQKKSDDEDGEGKDNWAESIDWEAIQARERAGKLKTTVPTERVVAPRSLPKDKISCYKEMLRIMRPDETVQKAIRRFGNSVPKRRPIKPKKYSSQAETSADLDPTVIAETKKKLDRLIELAHHRLEDGDTDIYQKSYEDLEEAINL